MTDFDDLSREALKLLLVLYRRGPVPRKNFAKVLGRYYDYQFIHELFCKGYLEWTEIVQESAGSGVFDYNSLELNREGRLAAKKYRGYIWKRRVEFVTVAITAAGAIVGLVQLL